MVNLLPAVLIGGPPHAGKTVLVYSLTRALRERGVPHHTIRACPDGEGDYSQESEPETVNSIRLAGKWSAPFVERIAHDLEHRCLPFLVDMGGRPGPLDAKLFGLGTYAVLLLKDDEPEATRQWWNLVADHALEPLAQLTSYREGTSTLGTSKPIIKGTLTRLERGNGIRASGPAFDALVECIATLFHSYTPAALERIAFEQAPSELFNLFTVVPLNERWREEMLPSLLGDLPSSTSYSIYGRAPIWVYAALAAHTNPQPFFQFDPRIGWTRPLVVHLGADKAPEVEVALRDDDAATLLTLNILSKHLAYLQLESLPFPPVSTEKGLVISGSSPMWLLTALVRLYQDAGIPWIALYYPQRSGAVVVYSRVPERSIGGLVTIQPVKYS